MNRQPVPGHISLLESEADHYSPILGRPASSHFGSEAHSVEVGVASSHGPRQLPKSRHQAHTKLTIARKLAK